jgi:hypothetical protein
VFSIASLFIEVQKLDASLASIVFPRLRATQATMSTPIDPVHPPSQVRPYHPAIESLSAIFPVLFPLTFV